MSCFSEHILCIANGRMRFGYCHVVNNDYPSGWGMYAIGGSEDPTFLSEGNRFVASSSKEVNHCYHLTTWFWNSCQLILKPYIIVVITACYHHMWFLSGWKWLLTIHFAEWYVGWSLKWQRFLRFPFLTLTSTRDIGAHVYTGDKACGWRRQGLWWRGELELGLEWRHLPQRCHIQKLGSQRRGQRVQNGNQFVSSAGVNGGIHHQRFGPPHVRSRGNSNIQNLSLLHFTLLSISNALLQASMRGTIHLIIDETACAGWILCRKLRHSVDQHGQQTFATTGVRSATLDSHC